MQEAAEIRYVVRQPILDAHSHLHGYELLFQLGAEGEAGGYGVHAVRAILDDTLLFGLDRLTNGVPAFINCTAEALTEPLVSILPPTKAVLEIPEQLEASPKLIGACRKLKEAGFRLALVDFTWGPMPHLLLQTVDYVKVNLTHLNRPGRERLRLALQGTSVVMIADRVDTQEIYQSARAEGFTLFQGYYFCCPELMRNTKVPSNRVSHIELLRLLRSDPLDLRKIEPLVKRDTSIVYRLLRLVNSPICAIRQEVHSIESAIMALGETTFRRIAMLAVLSELNAGQPAVILHMALVRARFCELAASIGRLDADEQYMLGMLSLLPAMLRQPMEMLVPELPLRPELGKALLGDVVPERCLLAWIEFHERNEISKSHAIADTYGLNPQRLEQFYVDAIVWETLAAATT